jgi:type IV pilus assembly protein PilM
MLIDIDVFSLETMYEANYTDAPESIVALVNVGASMINVNVLKDNMSIFARDNLHGRQAAHRAHPEGVQRETSSAAENIKTGADIEGIDLEKSTTYSRWPPRRTFQEIRRTW